MKKRWHRNIIKGTNWKYKNFRMSEPQILGLWTKLSTSLSCGKAIDFHEKLAVPNFSQNSPQMKRKRSMELNAKRIKDVGPCYSIKGFTWTLLSDAETCATTYEIGCGRSRGPKKCPSSIRELRDGNAVWYKCVVKCFTTLSCPHLQSWSGIVLEEFCKIILQIGQLFKNLSVCSARFDSGGTFDCVGLIYNAGPALPC